MTDTATDKVGYAFVGAVAIFSALGWFAIDRWVPRESEGSQVVIAVLRTMFTLMPAVAGFLIAGRKQRSTHRAIAHRLAELRGKISDFERTRRIEHELHTMDRLARVAREAVKNTASSAKELLGAIQTVNDRHVKERLVERYRYHTNNVVTVLSAVSEQMEESGRAIQHELTAEDAVHVLEREKHNTARGLEYAREIMEQRGITDGLNQITFAADQASQLQQELSSLKESTSPILELTNGE